MSSADASAGTELAPEAAHVLQRALELLDAGQIGQVSDAAVQDLLLAGAKLYFAKRDSGNKLAALRGPENITASEVATTCVGMTEVVNLELFELAMWAAWSNV